MSKFKYGTPEYELEEAKKKIDSALEKVSKIRNEVGKIEELTMIKTPSIGSLSTFYKGGYYNSFNPLKMEHLDRAWGNADNHIDDCIRTMDFTHEENSDKIVNNEETAQKVKDFMETIGIRGTYSVYDYPTNRHKTKKSITKTAGYIDDIGREIKTSDGYKFAMDSLKKSRERLRKEFDDLCKKIIEDEKRKELERKKQEDIKELARFQVKYDNNGEWWDILDVILNKNKYLKLGHYLLKNREDWNDGPSYAKYGLSQFEVDGENDERIANELLYLTDDWDGDGRVFRDSKYGYDYVFSLVNDEELMKDYETVKSKYYDFQIQI